jgi:ribose 5-phosphate isomerase RpiB
MARGAATRVVVVDAAGRAALVAGTSVDGVVCALLEGRAGESSASCEGEDEDACEAVHFER